MRSVRDGCLQGRQTWSETPQIVRLGNSITWGSFRMGGIHGVLSGPRVDLRGINLTYRLAQDGLEIAVLSIDVSLFGVP